MYPSDSLLLIHFVPVSLFIITYLLVHPSMRFINCNTLPYMRMIISVDRTTGSSLSVPHRKFDGGNGKLSVVINNSEDNDFSSDMESHSHVNNYHTPTTTTTALVTLSRRPSQMLVLFFSTFIPLFKFVVWLCDVFCV